MRKAPRGKGVLVLAALLICGCQGMGPRKMAANEPPLETVPGDGPAIVQAEPSRSVTWVDRHPLFAAPRDLYNSTNSNNAVKVAAATVVGVPVGLFGEIKQIVVGSPPELRGGY